MAKEKLEFRRFLELEPELEITIGKVTEAVPVEGTDKLMKLQVDFGSGTCQAVTNLRGQGWTPEDFEGKMFPFVTNLKPAEMMGVLSEAMIMPASEGKKALKEWEPGATLL